MALNIASAKPRLLCLHGEGCSAAIFQAQLRHVHDALRNDFDLVFVDAPFSSTAGPGILPFFEGPYYCWIRRPGHAQPDDAERVWDCIDAHHAQHGPFAGVIAFSQGCRVATTLLQQAQEVKEVGNETVDGGPDRPPSSLQYGLLFAGTYPPLPPRGGGDGKAEEDKSLIALPTVHIQGRRDPWQAQSRLLVQSCFDPQTTTRVHFVGGHHLPTAPKDKETIAAIAAWLAENALC